MLYKKSTERDNIHSRHKICSRDSKTFHAGLLDSRAHCRREKVHSEGATQPSFGNARICLFRLICTSGVPLISRPRISARRRQLARHVALQPKRASIFGGAERARRNNARLHLLAGEMLTTAFQRLLDEIKAQPTTRSDFHPNFHLSHSYVTILTGISRRDKAENVQ